MEHNIDIYVIYVVIVKSNLPDFGPFNYKILKLSMFYSELFSTTLLYNNRIRHFEFVTIM